MKKSNDWREAQNKLKEEELMKECTFTPELGISARNFYIRSECKNTADKSNFYERSNERCRRHQESAGRSFGDNDSVHNDRRSVEIKKPAKSLENKHCKTKASPANIKSVENTILRMREANLENKIIGIMKRTGL